jgi:hypothetical protein
MAIAGLIGRHLATRAVVGIGKKVYQSHKKRKKKKEQLKIAEANRRKKAKEFMAKHHPNEKKKRSFKNRQNFVEKT